MRIELRLFANLRQHLPADGDGTKASMELPDGSRIADVIERLGIPSQLAQLVMIDGMHETNRERVLHDGVVVSVFPPIAGGVR